MDLGGNQLLRRSRGDAALFQRLPRNNCAPQGRRERLRRAEKDGRAMLLSQLEAMRGAPFVLSSGIDDLILPTSRRNGVDVAMSACFRLIREFV